MQIARLLLHKIVYLSAFIIIYHQHDGYLGHSQQRRYTAFLNLSAQLCLLKIFVIILLDVKVMSDDIGRAIPYFKKYGVQKAAVFGSFARNEEKKDSDVDFIVSFSKKYDLLELVGLKQDLEDVLKRPVDIVTYNSLKSDTFAKVVLSEAKVVYEQN